MTELPTLYQQVITKTKYARWQEEERRRENWNESTNRLVDFYTEHLQERGTPLPLPIRDQLHEGILNLKVSPSMRAMMTAGPALARDHVAAYNCAFLFVNRLRAFSEILYILCCGTGVGFSVERDEVAKLPRVPKEFYDSLTTIVVPDSKIGWATAFHELISLLYAGKLPQIDLSLVRPAGMPLKTFGGRASGPEPLRQLFEHTIKVFKSAAGRKLTSEDCHSIVCMTGDIVVVGGVRRSALISLSDLWDWDMRAAKSGEWWVDHPHYRLANNSAVYEKKPTREIFDQEWQNLKESGSGERGIFNREAARKRSERIGRESRRFGVNPCGEILLRDREFCNLTEVTVRAEDSLADLKEKVELATVLGMIQSTFTDFRYLSEEWKKNCEEERLLGVSTTGDMDHPVLSGREGWDKMDSWLEAMRERVNATAREWATILNVNVPAASTTGKPAGNNSQRLNTASGAHARYAPFYERRLRMSKNDPVANLLYMQGIPCEDDIFAPSTTWVFTFPVAAPEGAVTRHDITALYQLEHWLHKMESWCDHNQSITINVRPHEWDEVADFVYENFDSMCGVSFLPDEDHVYQQAPYTEISEERYQELVAEMPEEIDWDLLSAYEQSDKTEGHKELACVAGSCEL